MEFVHAFSGISWAFPFHILCHVNFHKEVALDFFLFFFRTNSWNLEPGLGIQLECSEIRGTLSGLEFLDRKFNRN